MSLVLRKIDFAASHGVTPSKLSYYIRLGKLTAPALRPDGKVDADLAVAQLAVTVPAKREAVRSFVAPDLAKAAALSLVFTALETDFLRPAVRALGLTDTQGADLARCWHRFRARQSLGPGEPVGDR